MEKPTVPTPETSGPSSSAPTPESQGRQENMAVEKYRAPESPALSPRERFGVLGKSIADTATKIENLRRITGKEEADLANVREDLGVTPDQNETGPRTIIELRELEALQEQLEREREEIIQREADKLVEERVTETFAIFKTLTPEQLAQVGKTGKLPEEKVTLWSIFKKIFLERDAAQEQRFNIILAQAFARGDTTFYLFSRGDVTEFNIITQEIRPTIINLATKRITEEQEPSQIEEGKDQPQLTNGEPLQIPETSSASESSPSSSGESVAKS